MQGAENQEWKYGGVRTEGWQTTQREFYIYYGEKKMREKTVRLIRVKILLLDAR